MQLIENNYKPVSQLPIYVQIFESSIYYEMYPYFVEISLYADVPF